MASVTDWNAKGIVVPGHYIFHTLLERLGYIFGFQIPTRPSRYHQLLIGWQREVLDRFPVAEVVHYTLPIYDYHGSIKYFEETLGENLPGLHAELDVYVETLKTYIVPERKQNNCLIKQILGSHPQDEDFSANKA